MQFVNETTEAAQAELCSQLRFSMADPAHSTLPLCHLSSSKGEEEPQLVPGNDRTQATCYLSEDCFAFLPLG